MERGLWLPCASIFRVPDAVQRAAMRRRAGTHDVAGEAMDPGSAVQHFVPHCVRGTRDVSGQLDHPLTVSALLLFRALPDHAGISLQRHQRFAGVGPFLQLLDRDVIERLPPGAA